MNRAASAVRETRSFSEALPRRALALASITALHLGLLWTLGRGLRMPERMPEPMPEPAPDVVLAILPAPPPQPAPRPVPPRVEHSARPAPVLPRHAQPAVERRHPTPVVHPSPAPRARPRPIPAAAFAPAAAAPRASPPEPEPEPAPAPAPAPTEAPAETPAPPTAPAAARSASAPPSMGLLCPQQQRPRIPDLAIEEGIGGTVLARAVVQQGRVRSVTIVSGPSVFREAVRRAMLDYRCSDQGARAVTVTQEFRFDVE